MHEDLTGVSFCLNKQTPPWTDEASSIRDGQQHQVLTVERSASHVIALIDFSPEMFPEGVEDTLKSIQIFCKELISIKAINKTAKRNGVGIWAFNTRERPKIEQPIEEESEDMVHPESMETDDQEDDDPEEERQGTTVHTLLPLTQPSLSVVRRLDSINIRELEHVYGHIDNNDDDSSHTGGVKNLKSAIFLAQDAFATAKCVRKPKPGEAQDAKEIWIFTAQDQPCESKEMLKDFQNFIKDHTREKRIELVVFGLKENFDYSLFYHRIRAQTPNRDLVLADQVWNRLNVIKKTRRAFGLPLLLPGWKERGQQGPNIMIDFFRLVQKAKPPSQKDVDIETGE